jgi:catechol 2,3-dioxygenase-like lactoylglutathione lyase family enzyme
MKVHTRGEDKMFKRIAHVCLNVKDLDRSLAFYTRIGFEPVFRFTRQGRRFGVYLRLAASSFIEIFEDASLTAPVNTGLVHFCLETDDLDGLLLRLRERGVACSEKKLGCDDTWQIWLSDPDGNRFEVHQYTPKSLQFAGGTVEANW